MKSPPATSATSATSTESATSSDSGLQAVADSRRQARRGPSLRGRALRFLARREHSRAELRSKLIGPDVDPVALDALLDDLVAKRLLSDRRYAEILAQSKGSRYGAATLARTLSQQGVSPELAAEALAPLRATERERGLEIWRRRFGAPPADLRERARQHRFLLGRGFDPSTVSWVLKQAEKAREF